MLQSLPNDLLLLILSNLDIQSVTALSYSSQRLRALAISALPVMIQSSGLSLAVTVPNLRLSPALSPGQLFSRLARASKVEQQWKQLDGVRHYLARSQRRTMPVLRLQRFHKVVLSSSGPDLSILSFDHKGRCDSSFSQQGYCRKAGKSLGLARSDDITAMAQTGDDSPDIVVAHHSGLVHRVHLEPSKDPSRYSMRSVARFDACPGHPIHPTSRVPVQGVSTDHTGSFMASICRPRRRHSRSIIALHQLRSPWVEPTTIHLPNPLWSVAVSSETTCPWVAVGQSSQDSLLVYNLRPEGLSCPVSIGIEEQGNRKAAVPYSLVIPRTGVLSPQHLIAAGYDGNTRVYDLR